MTVPERRRPGKGGRTSGQGFEESFPPPARATEDLDLHIHIHNGKGYEKVRVQRSHGHEPYVAPTIEGEVTYGPNLNRTMVCGECRTSPANLVEEAHSGDMVCGDCGLVLDRIISTESEWRSFSNADNGENHGDKSRVGGGENPLFSAPELEFQTSIVGQGDAFKTLERAQKKAAGSDGKKVSSLVGAFRDIQALASKAHYADIAREVAQQVYKIYRDEPGGRKTFNYECVLGTCLMIGCRQAGYARSFKEICALCNCKIKDLGRTFKAIEEIIKRHDARIKEKTAQNIHVHNNLGTYSVESNVTSAVDLVVRMIEALNLSMKVRLMTEHIAGIEEKELSVLAGRRPSTVAAAALFLAIKFAGLPTTIQEVSEVAKISHSTLGKSYKLLCAHAERLIEPRWITEGSGDMSRVGQI